MGRIKIKSENELRRNLDKLLDSLGDGPVFVARDKRVSAVLLDISDYYDILGEIEDLMKLLHTVGGCGCDEEDRLLDEVFGEAGD
jgi:PHD/YefM family antitoxin component YafN of YafNO toxin-antitoxin module